MARGQAADRGGESIEDFMARRAAEVSRLGGRAEDLGRAAWASTTRTGENFVAPRPIDVRTLGFQYAQRSTTTPPHPQPTGRISRGEKATLSDDEIANIIFNETRSLSGQAIEDSRVNIAHAIINGDEALGAKRPKTAPSSAVVPSTESAAYESAKAAVATARAQRARGSDPTGGARHFNFRPGSSRAPFFGNPIRTQTGPFKNSYPTNELPEDNVYANTYDD